MNRRSLCQAKWNMSARKTNFVQEILTSHALSWRGRSGFSLGTYFSYTGYLISINIQIYTYSQPPFKPALPFFLRTI